jgi:hypothetical protein
MFVLTRFFWEKTMNAKQSLILIPLFLILTISIAQAALVEIKGADGSCLINDVIVEQNKGHKYVFQREDGCKQYGGAWQPTQPIKGSIPDDRIQLNTQLPSNKH